MNILETERLIICRLSIVHAAFILELLNDEAFLRFIGDKGVRTLDDAREYILNGPIYSYERYGFGLFLATLKEGGVPVGICGLLKRASLTDIDLGYAFVPEFRGRGYAFESASAVMAYGANVLGLTRIVAVSSPDNRDSINLLEKLGMRFEKMVRLTDGDVDVSLFGVDFQK